jgi:hypothetical protein
VGAPHHRITASWQQTKEQLMKYLLALLAGVHLSAFAASETPEAAAEAFNRWVLSHPNGGLPSSEQRKQLTRLLTADSVRLLASASEAQRRCVAVTPPDMKGPIWEGSLFVSTFEGASEVWYGDLRAEGRDVVVDVNLLGVDASLPKGHKTRTYTWRDSVKLRKEKRGWVVADVMRGESLTAMLREYVKEGTACLR